MTNLLSIIHYPLSIINSLVVFGRLPHSSLPAKTRLGKEIGDMQKARAIGHFLTKNTLDQFSNFDAQKYFCYGGDIPEIEFEKIKNQYPEYTFFPQPEGKDVRGLQEAFEYIYKKNPNAKAIIIGTDIIGLDTQIVQNCFTALNEYDVAMVAVEDNGYGLIGTSKNIDVISEIKNFESRSEGYHLVNETKELCKRKGYSLFIHPKICFDIDTESDLERTKSVIPEFAKA